MFYAFMRLQSLLELVERLLVVLDELDGAHVLAIRIVDGRVAHADGAAHDAAVDFHVRALLCLEVEQELAQTGMISGGWQL